MQTPDERLKTIMRLQAEFQTAVDINIDSKVETERNKMAETFLFKAIEECVELRKTFPSALNPWAKSQPEKVVREDMLGELSDTLLFLINFMLVFRLQPEEILETMRWKQHINFTKVKERLLAQLNELQLRVPDEKVGIGDGNIFPRYIFVGQNPGQAIPHKGYRFFSEAKGAAAVLLKILDKHKMREQCYFTNLVKVVTPHNAPPDKPLIEYWYQHLKSELRILNLGTNPRPRIIALGKVAQGVMGIGGIPHPATVLRGSLTEEMYESYFLDFINPF
jgi:uracil-DNA glycosylase family 4